MHYSRKYSQPGTITALPQPGTITAHERERQLTATSLAVII